jgi:NADPH:quinone reductase-like Zn-dependent oxidoreductase
MKAVVLNEYGDADRLRLADVPEPKAGAGEIKVRVAGASVNPIDWKLRGGGYQKFMALHFPAILGVDAAGTVVETGPGVSAFKAGARVMGRVHAGYAQFVVAKEGEWSAVPETLDLADDSLARSSRAWGDARVAPWSF